jgi:transketolase
MAHSGYFPVEELLTLRQFGSRLQGHPERLRLPGIEQTSGPLGEGLGQAAGYAYSLQYLDNQPHRFVYVMMGDGELNEGNIWESAMFAGKYKLSQLVAFVDRNNIQIDGSTEDVMPLEDLRGKWESFGWHVQEIDGHNIESVIDAASMARAITNKPSVILAHTIPGKGVDFMEYDYKWHGVPPNKEQAAEALKKLRTLDGKINHEGEAW